VPPKSQAGAASRPTATPRGKGFVWKDLWTPAVSTPFPPPRGGGEVDRKGVQHPWAMTDCVSGFGALQAFIWGRTRGDAWGVRARPLSRRPRSVWTRGRY
jgi:hypothetical protein